MVCNSIIQGLHVFFIWPHTSEDLNSFIERLNEFHPTIKFTSEQNNERINFLDTTVIKEKDGTTYTTLYTKPTDVNTYLHYNSNHPPHQKRSIPYSQALRIRRICKRTEYFEVHTQRMHKKFLE